MKIKKNRETFMALRRFMHSFLGGLALYLMAATPGELWAGNSDNAFQILTNMPISPTQNSTLPDSIFHCDAAECGTQSWTCTSSSPTYNTSLGECLVFVQQGIAIYDGYDIPAVKSYQWCTSGDWCVQSCLVKEGEKLEASWGQGQWKFMPGPLCAPPNGETYTPPKVWKS